MTKQGASIAVPSDGTLDSLPGSSSAASTSALPIFASSASRLPEEISLIITSVETSGSSAHSSSSHIPAISNSNTRHLDPQLRPLSSTIDPFATPLHLSQPELLRLWNEERKSWALERDLWVSKEMIHNREKLEWNREREALKAAIKIDVNVLEDYLRGLRGEEV